MPVGERVGVEVEFNDDVGNPVVPVLGGVEVVLVYVAAMVELVEFAELVGSPVVPVPSGAVIEEL